MRGPPRRVPGAATFTVGAAVASITPPAAGSLAHDPASCSSDAAYNGTHASRSKSPTPTPRTRALRNPAMRSSTATAMAAGTASCSGAAPTRRASRARSPTRSRRVRSSSRTTAGRSSSRCSTKKACSTCTSSASAPQVAADGYHSRRHLHLGDARRVGPRHARNLRCRPDDVRRRRVLRRLHGAPSATGDRDAYYRASRPGAPASTRRRSSPRTSGSAGRRTRSSTTS